MDPPDAETVSAARRQALSVGVATGLYGLSFGALAVASGLSTLQACVSSLLLFSGGSQFALVGVLGGGGSVWAAVASSSLLGIRNGLYALQVNALLRPGGWLRPAAAHLTIDESTAVAVAQPTLAARRIGFWTTGLTVFLGWNAMTFVGALLGSAVGDPRTYGLDAAAAAAFLALLWPRLRTRDSATVAFAGAAVAAVLVPLVPVGLPIVAAGVVGLFLGLRTQSRSMSTTWIAVLASSAIAYALKLSGYLVPPHRLSHPRLVPALTLLPAALLAALVVVQSLTSGRHLELDARIVAVGVAALALWRRAPFILVVVLGAASAALVRAAGWG